VKPIALGVAVTRPVFGEARDAKSSAFTRSVGPEHKNTLCGFRSR
jgi:hypothetical protein